MIQYIWIFLLFGSTYVSLMDSVISSSFPAYKNVTVYQSFAFNATKTSTSSNDNQHEFTNRSARDARLLKGETMGGLEGCASFEVGDVAKREFYSPNYPEDYPRDIICTKKIIANSSDQHVIVDFRDQFAIEPSDGCKFDRLEIRDGAYGYSPEIGKFCDHQFPPVIKSSGSALWLRFKSDDSIEYKGFRAVYYFEPRKDVPSDLNDEPCVVNKTEEDEINKEKDIRFVLSDSDIPEYFKNKSVKSGIDCMFNLQVEENKKVSLTWESFNLQFPNDCELNYVNILEENTDTIRHTFCGAAAEPIVFASNLMRIQYVVKKAAINSTFKAHFTPFRAVSNCTADEFNCQDGNCIHLYFQCDKVANCLTASDEDDEECKKLEEQTFWQQVTKLEMLIILIVFFLILFGMCFTLIFNIVRKLIHDLAIIKAQVNQSRDSQLDQLGRKTPTATILTPVITVLPNLPDSLINATEITANNNACESVREEEEDENEAQNCYVPTEHTFPRLIRRDCGFEKINGGPQYHSDARPAHRESGRDYNGDEEEDGLVTQSGDSIGYMPEMRDNECQTRESLFYNSSSTSDSTTNKSSLSPSPPPPPPPPPPGTVKKTHIKPAAVSAVPPFALPPAVGFTTFGYKNNQKPDKISRHSKEHKFRAEAVIEMERFKSPKHDTSSIDSKPSRPYSVQSTKSAPDVIVTH